MTAKLAPNVDPWPRQFAPGPALKVCTGCGDDAMPAYGDGRDTWCRDCRPRPFWAHEREAAGERLDA